LEVALDPKCAIAEPRLRVFPKSGWRIREFVECRRFGYLSRGRQAMLEEQIQRVEAVSPENRFLAICHFRRLD